MKTETWVRLAAIGICTVTAGAVGYAAVKYFAGILLPFLLAALASSALRPAAEKLQRQTRIPVKVGGTLLIVLAAGVLVTGMVCVGSYAYDGARDLIAAMRAELEEESGPLHALEDLSVRLRSVFPEEEERLGSLSSMVSQMIREAVSGAGTALSGLAGSALMGLPRLFLSLLVGVIALFYLFFDTSALRRQALFFVSERTLCSCTRFLSRIREAVGGCLRAYLLLLFLTFSELLAGFLLLNVDRAVLAALLTSLVDLLPVFGVGTVLVPWSILRFLSGDVFRGVGLLVLFGVMVTVRQFLEPRIVGGSLGLHPLLTLLAVFAGFRLFGFAGMLGAPILLYAVKAAVSGEDEKEKSEE